MAGMSIYSQVMHNYSKRAIDALPPHEYGEWRVRDFENSEILQNEMLWLHEQGFVEKVGHDGDGRYIWRTTREAMEEIERANQNWEHVDYDPYDALDKLGVAVEQLELGDF